MVQDIFSLKRHSADLVLPASTFAEKDGTFTNTERRIQRVRRAIQPIDGQARLIILMELMNRLGYHRTIDIPLRSEEIASVTPSYARITYDRIDQEDPVALSYRGSPGTKYRHGSVRQDKDIPGDQYTPSRRKWIRNTR